MSWTRLLQVLDTLGAPRILVLGDVLLDRYTWGAAERISQEAPAVVLRAEREEARLGGAGNVGNMLAGLGAVATVAGVVGRDTPAEVVRQLCAESGIDASLLVECESRPTTVKQRFIGSVGTQQPSQLLRVDSEVREPLPTALEARLSDALAREIARHDLLLISDYGKGVCTPNVLRAAIGAARADGTPIAVDPIRGGSYEQYRGATLLKPNRVETELATGCRIVTPEDAFRAGHQLCQQLELELAVVTLDRDGMTLVRRDGQAQAFPTTARSVYDVTGAGDLVLAALGVCLAAGGTPEDAVRIANLAGGLEVEKFGASVVHRDEIRSQILSMVHPGIGKLMPLEKVAESAVQRRRQGERVVFTNGCFDLLHVGHVAYLNEAAAMGDVLVVGINSDASVRRLKGPQRPMIGEVDRAAMLGALACVDYVVIFDDATPHRLLEAIRPDVLVKGGNYQTQDVVGREVVESYGGQIRVAGCIDGVSTTRIIQSFSAGGRPPLTSLRQAASDVSGTSPDVPHAA